MNIKEALIRIKELPLEHRAGFLAIQLEEICRELNVELHISCDSASIHIRERVTCREKPVVHSYKGYPWIRFEDERENTPF